MDNEVWELNAEQIHKLIVAGVEPDEIDGLNRQRKETYDLLIQEVYGDDPAEVAELHFHNKYGFDHVCHCVDDMFTDNTVRIPKCRYQMGDDALEALEARNVERDELAAAVEQLRIQLVSVGEVPVV
jgi:hypothetical protein